VNGDGYADIIVGAEEVEVDVGRAYVYMGGPSGISPTQEPAALTGPDGLPGPGRGGGLFGRSVASAGDVNADGYGDVVVGAYKAGRAYLYRGSALGISPTQAPTKLEGFEDSGTGFGVAVSGAGDVNGDGYADIVVGDDVVDGSSGRAYVFLGGAWGMSGAPQPTALMAGLGAGEQFGARLALAGDVDGDGYDGVLVAAHAAADDNAGRAFVFFGGASGLGSQPLTLMGTPGIPGLFGSAVAGAGDTDGDGYADVLVASPPSGEVYLYPGAAAISSSHAFAPRRTFVAPEDAGTFFGYAVAQSGLTSLSVGASTL